MMMLLMSLTLFVQLLLGLVDGVIINHKLMILFMIVSFAKYTNYIYRYQIDTFLGTTGEGAFHGLLKNAHGDRGKPETGFALKPNKPNTLAEETVPMRRMNSADTRYEKSHHMRRIPSLEKRGFYEKTTEDTESTSSSQVEGELL